MREKPKSIKVFIFCSLILVPGILASLIYKEVNFAFSGELDVELSSVLLMRSFIKICLIVYSLALSNNLIKNRSDSKAVVRYLIVMGIAPLILQLPFVVLALKWKSLDSIPFEIALKTLPLTLIFCSIWFVHFLTSDSSKEFLSTDIKKQNV